MCRAKVSNFGGLGGILSNYDNFIKLEWCILEHNSFLSLVMLRWRGQGKRSQRGREGGGGNNRSIC